MDLMPKITKKTRYGAHTDPNGKVKGNVGDEYKSVESLGGDGTLWVKHTGAWTKTGWI